MEGHEYKIYAFVISILVCYEMSDSHTQRFAYSKISPCTNWYEAGREARASSEEEVALSVTWFLHLFLRLALKEKTARLRTLDLFLFSAEKVRKHLLSCVREKVTKTRPFYQSQLSSCVPPPILVSPEDTKGSSFRNVAFFSEHYMTGKMQKLSTDSEMIPVGRKRGWGRVCRGVGADGYKRVYSTATGRNYRLLLLS